MKKLIFLSIILLAFSACTKKTDLDPIILKIFSNLPDRRNGQGLVEQTIIDRYMQQNPGVKIELEALDEEAYKIKFKAYCMETLPDIVSVWGEKAFLHDAMDSGILAELNEMEFRDYGFKPGSLESFKNGGALYGLPRNTDVAVFYYNEGMFTDYRWELPRTYEELLALADQTNIKGVIPVALDGGDGWPLAMYISDLLLALAGDEYKTILSNAFQSADFTHPLFRQAVELFVESAKHKLFQNNFVSDDYGTAQSLFLSGKAAMYYMGSWETGMAKNIDLPERIKSEIRMFTMPPVNGGRRRQGEILAWNGGGYSVSQKSPHLDAALDFYKFIFKPENLSALGIEYSVGLSAQYESAFITGKENILLGQLIEIVEKADSISGYPFNDMGTANFKQTVESNIQRLMTGDFSVDDFLVLLHEACIQ